MTKIKEIVRLCLRNKLFVVCDKMRHRHKHTIYLRRKKREKKQGNPINFNFHEESCLTTIAIGNNLKISIFHIKSLNFKQEASKQTNKQTIMIMITTAMMTTTTTVTAEAEATEAVRIFTKHTLKFRFRITLAHSHIHKTFKKVFFINSKHFCLFAKLN